MPGSSNFTQFNPVAVNQESDAAYAADSQRSGGIAAGSIIASPLLNKAFFQWSTMVAALGAMLAAKGYIVSDANLVNLQTALANLITSADLAASPALGGNPTAPTQAAGDNSTRIATTAFLRLGFSITLAPLFGGIIFPTWLGGLILNFGVVTGPVFSATVNLVYPFPTAAIACFCTPSSGGATVSASFPNNSHITVASSVASQLNWLAIGY